MGHYDDNYYYVAEQKEKRLKELKASMSKKDLKKHALRALHTALYKAAIREEEKIAAEWLIEEFEKLI